MTDEVKERRQVYHGTYTNITVRPRERIGDVYPHKYYTVTIHNSMELPLEIDNVKLTSLSGGITVFDFAGTLYIGGDNKSELTIYEYPNKVIQGEIKVK